MSDLNIVDFWHCDTFEQFGPARVESSDGTHVYRVEFGPTPLAATQRGWTCTCVGFEFRGSCQHIEEVKPRRCGWSQFMDGGEPVHYASPPAAHCPECGNECRSMGWGV